MYIALTITFNGCSKHLLCTFEMIVGCCFKAFIGAGYLALRVNSVFTRIESEKEVEIILSSGCGGHVCESIVRCLVHLRTGSSAESSGRR